MGLGLGCRLIESEQVKPAGVQRLPPPDERAEAGGGEREPIGTFLAINQSAECALHPHYRLHRWRQHHWPLSSNHSRNTGRVLGFLPRPTMAWLACWLGFRLSIHGYVLGLKQLVCKQTPSPRSTSQGSSPGRHPKGDIRGIIPGGHPRWASQVGIPRETSRGSVLPASFCH